MTLFAELKRRNVVRVGIAYSVFGWVLAQIAGFLFDTFGAADWVLQSFVAVLMLGMPVALFFAWAFELTPDGIKRETGLSHSKSSNPQTNHMLDRAIIVVLIVAVGWLLLDKFYLSDTVEPLVKSDLQSIAVLPFTNMSDDSDHFADGLSEELLNLLAKNADLKVAGRTSSFVFKGRNQDLREIGVALGVQHLLEGSVRRSGDRLRITAQLIKADDGFHVWSETYDRAITDIFEVQDSVASAISTELNLRLVPESKRITDNIEAYALYLESLSVVSYDASADAIDLLKRAIALDPEFAKAYEQLALVYWLAAGTIVESSVAVDLIRASATRALAIDSTLPMAKAVLSSTDTRSEWNDHIKNLESAAAAEPKNTHILNMLSAALLATGYYRESLEIADRTVVLDPVSAIPQLARGQVLSARGQREQARRAFVRSAELGMEGMDGMIAMDYFVAREYDAAIEVEERYRAALGEDPALVRPAVERILDPDTGKQFLDAYVEERVRATANRAAAVYEYQWYQAFGYTDEFWAKIEELRASAGSDWSPAGDLVGAGAIWPLSGFRRHPSYLSQAKIDLWESRGAPDTCSKASGEWVCE